jgi:beta-phosphoglucomutase
LLKGIIFDMDGVLVDSEEFICEAATRMFAEYGITVKPEDFRPFVGAGENRYVGGVAEKYGLDAELEVIKARTYEIYGEVVKGKLKPFDGVNEFIDNMKARGFKLAVASSADRIKIEINLMEAGLPAETFDVIVSGLDVVNKKPDPEIFLKAARKLSLLPAECLVVEDAVNGVAAAKAGGFRCLGLTTSFTAEKLSGADWIVPNLKETPTEVLEW